ncbi:MAG: YfcE family phosphodiesterase [Bacteroidota bacterium]|nr:YfcE family phosphodiesterase [Bacteroidota bacterium]
MKSMICSDIHDQVQHLESALMVANTSNCNSVICCGDLCSTFMLNVYNSNCNLPLHLVFGNNDGDRFHMANKSSELNQQRPEGQKLHLHGEFLLAEKGHSLEGIPEHIAIAVYHYPEMARVIALSGKYNTVCFGHSHKSSIEKVNDTILVNPGSLMGYISGSVMQQVKPSCIIANWFTGELDLIEI